MDLAVCICCHVHSICCTFFSQRPFFVTKLLFLGSSTSRIINNLNTQQQTMIISVKNVHLFNRKRKKITIFCSSLQLQKQAADLQSVLQVSQFKLYSERRHRSALVSEEEITHVNQSEIFWFTDCLLTRVPLFR